MKYSIIKLIYLNSNNKNKHTLVFIFPKNSMLKIASFEEKKMIVY
jgi:hypothetical protein